MEAGVSKYVRRLLDDPRRRFNVVGAYLARKARECAPVAPAPGPAAVGGPGGEDPFLSLDLAFDRIMDAESADRLVRAQGRVARSQKMGPVVAAFDRLLRTRKPMVRASPDAAPEPLAAELDAGAVSAVQFHLRRDDGVRLSVQILDAFSDGFAVAESENGALVVHDYYDDWTKAYERTLEYLAPYIASYKRRT